MNGWTGPEVAAAANISHRTLLYWTERGLIVASIREGRGSGHAAIFSDDDLVTAVILGSMRSIFTLDGLALVAAMLQRQGKAK